MVHVNRWSLAERKPGPEESRDRALKQAVDHHCNTHPGTETGDGK